MSKLSLIVVGEINIDIIISGLPHFPKPGHLVNGEQLSFGPGGKSRNIAAMASVLMPAASVAMISKTAQDEHSLWEIPVKALREAGVNTEHITVIDNPKSGQLPGFAVILVDKKGNNQIIGAPGVTQELNAQDIDAASSLFEEVAANNGFMAFIGNCPVKSAKHAVQKAANLGIKVVFDPGGTNDFASLLELLDEKIYLFKPNEHEAEALTDVKVTNFESAKQAAHKIMARGVKNVLITAGSSGAFLFTPDTKQHIPVTELELGSTRDETGCGDQVMAALCAFMSAGENLETATERAILAGTLQFHKPGIQPTSSQEISKYIGRDK